MESENDELNITDCYSAEILNHYFTIVNDSQGNVYLPYYGWISPKTKEFYRPKALRGMLVRNERQYLYGTVDKAREMQPCQTGT